jgi:hypothetical protein
VTTRKAEIGLESLRPLHSICFYEFTPFYAWNYINNVLSKGKKRANTLISKQKQLPFYSERIFKIVYLKRKQVLPFANHQVNYIPGYPQSNDIERIKNFGSVQSTRLLKKCKSLLLKRAFAFWVSMTAA